ncbi:MAG: hypothetical protein RSB50_06160 [Cetobacterium sp.]
MDHNKLDDYKTAIDDGFILTKFLNATLEVKIMKGEGGFYSFTTQDTSKWERYRAASDDWTEFKIMVADFFLGVDEK